MLWQTGLAGNLLIAGSYQPIYELTRRRMNIIHGGQTRDYSRQGSFQIVAQSSIKVAFHASESVSSSSLLSNKEEF